MVSPSLLGCFIIFIFIFFNISDIIAQQQQQIGTGQHLYYPQTQFTNQQLKGKAKFNLPPISTIMVEDSPNLAIPFFFHHPKFGLEDCMIQWSKSSDSRY